MIGRRSLGGIHREPPIVRLVIRLQLHVRITRIEKYPDTACVAVYLDK